MGAARVRLGLVAAAVVLLVGQIGWAMEPRGGIPSTQPGAKADPARISAALRAAPASYAAWKAKSVALHGKEKVVSAGPVHTKPLLPTQQASPPAAAAASRQIASALADLKARRPDVDVRFDHRTGAAVWIKGAKLHVSQRARAMSGAADTAASSQAAAADGLEALQEYRGLLRITDASREFVHRETKTDSMGLTHVKYQQVCQGLPVWNKQIWVHLDPQGATYLIEGRAAPTPGIAAPPRVTSEQAIAVARADLGQAEDLAAEQVVYTDGLGLAHLAWHVTATRNMERRHVFVDAAYGVILHRASDTRYEGVASSGTDLLGRSDSFSSWQQDGQYYLIDTSTPVHVSDPLVPNELGKGNLVIFDGKNQDPDSNLTAYFLTSGSPAGHWDAAGVNVVNSLRSITDYYKSHLGRDGIDARSLNAIAFVHVGTAWENAAWTGQVIFLGDGGQHLLSLARGLDVIAHEYSHGVVDHSASFEYQFQSGALHEAFADIFAAMVDRANWTMGEDVVPGGRPLRDLVDPRNSLDTQASTMDDYQALPLSVDNGGVHVNATIVGHAAYLMAEGLANAIGRDKVERIFYRALTTHLTAQSNFADCRAATIQSAQELFPDSAAEAQAVTDAWDAVKVGSSGGTGGGGGGGGGQIPPVQGTDSLVFLAYDDHGRPRQAFTASDGYAYYVSPMPVSLTRAVVTAGGTAVLYVDATNNLRMASLSLYDDYDEAITTDGSVRSICGSKDGRYFAFTDTPVRGVYDNKLYVLDLDSEGNDKTFDLYMPSPDGGATTSLLDHSDVMDFDISNAHVIFDGLNHFSVSGTQQDYTFWSVGILDIGTGRISNLLPAQPQGIQIGNPAASSTRDWILAVDVVDPAAGTCQTRVINLQTGKSGLVVEQSDNGINGWPSFNGDDTLLAVQYGGSIVSVPVATDSEGTVQGDFAGRQTLEPDAYFPRYYRAGQVGGKPKISLSASSIDFGEVEVGSEGYGIVTISNVGDYPLSVTGYSLSDSSQFQQDGVPMEIPAGYELDVNVTFTPAAAGAQSGVLTITSDDPDVPQVQVQLAGEGTDSSSAGSRRCFIATAAYGSYLEPHVVALRTFRDRHLLTNAPGRVFVRAYYRWSPPIAAVIAGHDSLRAAVRAGLTPVVLAVQYPGAAGAGVVVLLVGMTVLLHRRRRTAASWRA